MSKTFDKNKIKFSFFGILAVIAMIFGGALPASAKVGDVVNPLVAKTYNYTSEYGGRCVPTLWASANHLGQDFSAADGTNIRSIADGTVSYIQNPSGSSVSGKIAVKHKIDGKTYYSAYLHMWKPTQYVKVGQTVKKGQLIAKVGSSGPSTGPHLHFEIWENAYKGSGKVINPTTFMKNQGVDLKAQATRVSTVAQPATCTYYATTTTTLKKSASSTSSNLTTLSKGDKMSSPNAVTTQSGNYLKATVNGKTGWIYRGHISRNYVAPAVKSGDTYKTNANVNFRTGAGTNYSIIKYLQKGTTVTTTGKTSGNWWQIQQGGKTGWISSNYLTKSTPTSPTPPKPKQTFTDVTPSTAFYTEIETLASRNISKGWTMSNGTKQYRPAEPVKRDAMIVFIYRAMGSPAYTPPKESPFSDVSTNNVFYKEIAWAHSQGIANGWKMKDGTRQFRPLENVKRDAVAAFLMRASGDKAPSLDGSSFKDVNKNTTFAAEIQWMKDNGISTGYADGTYRPLVNTKRDQMAAFVIRWDNKY